MIGRPSQVVCLALSWSVRRAGCSAKTSIPTAAGTAFDQRRGLAVSHVDHDLHASHESGISRRDVLCAGGAAMFSSLVATLLGGAQPARAQGLNGPVPEVDRLAVRVVTDSYQLAIAPNMKVGEVEVQRFGMPPAGRSLLGEFGLSMH